MPASASPAFRAVAQYADSLLLPVRSYGFAWCLEGILQAARAHQEQAPAQSAVCYVLCVSYGWKKFLKVLRSQSREGKGQVVG